MEGKFLLTHCKIGLIGTLTVVALCIALLCSCGGGDNKVAIYWNATEKTYLLADEVKEAPSGELRIKKTGRYLQKSSWVKKDVLKSELEVLKHHEE
jgi:hypothetical protein